jgi:hypothetical protein
MVSGISTDDFVVRVERALICVTGSAGINTIS